jgi:hypothetical protein
MTQGRVHGWHVGPCPQDTMNGRVQDRGEIIGHDDGVQPETGSGSFRGGKADGNPTRMTETRKVTRNHDDDRLWQAGV